MNLNLSQLQAIKADIAANSDLNSAVSDQAVADLYNAIASPSWYAWSTSVDKQVIKDNIAWSNFTPNDAPDGTTLWTNRAIQCYGKRDNAWAIIEGTSTYDASKPTQRAGLQDALTGIPSGASGVSRNAGWTAVQRILSRLTTRAEKLLSTGTGTQAIPATMTFTGLLAASDIDAARHS